jgi:hypothetical protein
MKAAIAHLSSAPHALMFTHVASGFLVKPQLLTRD